MFGLPNRVTEISRHYTNFSTSWPPSCLWFAGMNSELDALASAVDMYL
jgi:hypothetical protein